MKNTGQFQKGNIPQYPIRPGEHRGKSTEFGAGHTPKNKLAVGDVTIRQERSGTRRAWVKIEEPNKWILRAVSVWLNAGGLIPKGFILHHLNENTLDDRIENLACVTKGGHINQHRMKLRNARGQTIPIKTIICSRCGDSFNGKYQKQNSFCRKCLHNNKRILSANRRKRKANSA